MSEYTENIQEEERGSVNTAVVDVVCVVINLSQVSFRFAIEL